jgi:hypothetical protein
MSDRSGEESPPYLVSICRPDLKLELYIRALALELLVYLVRPRPAKVVGHLLGGAVRRVVR